MEIVNIVDEKGKVVKTMPRHEAVFERRQAARILITNSRNEILIQRRSQNKKFYPLHLDLGVAETVQAGESAQDAAIRGLKEELSIDVESLEKWGCLPLDLGKYQRWYEMFKLVYDGEYKIDDDEVCEARFVSKQELDELVKTDKFIPGALLMIEKLNEVKI